MVAHENVKNEIGRSGYVANNSVCMKRCSLNIEAWLTWGRAVSSQAQLLLVRSAEWKQIQCGRRARGWFKALVLVLRSLSAPQPLSGPAATASVTLICHILYQLKIIHWFDFYLGQHGGAVSPLSNKDLGLRLGKSLHAGPPVQVILCRSLCAACMFSHCCLLTIQGHFLPLIVREHLNSFFLPLCQPCDVLETYPGSTNVSCWELSAAPVTLKRMSDGWKLLWQGQCSSSEFITVANVQLSSLVGLLHVRHTAVSVIRTQ